MEKMFNPFLEGTANEETPVSYILDKALNGSADQKAVFKFFQYLISIKGTADYDNLINSLIDILGQENYNLIKTVYLDTYNPETKIFSRYAYFDDRNEIKKIFMIFIEINKNLPKLRLIANGE